MSDFESTAQILTRAIDKILPGHNLGLVRLTPDGLSSWDSDDAQRFRDGRGKVNKDGEPILPLRNMATQQTFQVEQFESPGRVWVRCPNRAQGFAPLNFGEFEFCEQSPQTAPHDKTPSAAR